MFHVAEQNFKIRMQTFSFLNFASGGRNHVMPANYWHCVQFFYAIKVRAGRKLCLSAQAAVQMLFRQIKNTHSLRSKILQNKSFKSRKMEKRTTFLTLAGVQMRLVLHFKSDVTYSILSTLALE